MSCTFCGKGWVQGCWTKEEAWRCGNNDGTMMPKATPPKLPKRIERKLINAQRKLIEAQAEASEYRKSKE
jgi:hypothetical protein